MDKNYHLYALKDQDLRTGIGTAVSLWAHLEVNILTLGAWAMKLPIGDTALTFSAFKTFALTLDFTQAMCRARIENRDYLNSLFDLIREVSGDRNFLAHTPVLGDVGDQTDWAQAVPKVGPSISALLADTADKREPMDLAEVAEVCADIQFLIGELSGFQSMLQDAPEPWPEKYLRPIQPRRPRLAERRGNGGKAPKPQQQS